MMDWELSEVLEKFENKVEGLADDITSGINSLPKNYVIMVLVVMLSLSLFGNLLSYSSGKESVISPEKAGQKTVDTVNSNILGPSPNNVTATLVNVTSAHNEGLENFYRVRLNVTNPSGSQITSVYTKKDGSLAFLQFPRRLGDEFQKGRYS